MNLSNDKIFNLSGTSSEITSDEANFFWKNSK